MPHASKKLSVAFLYDDTLDGSDGVAQYVKTLGTWLNDQGHTVNYFAGETKLDSYHGGKIYSLSKNLKVVFNGNRLSMPLFSGRRAIKRALADARPDVLNVQMPHSPLMAQRVINIAKLPTVGTFHVFPANKLASTGGKLLKLLYLGGLKKIDEVVSVSPAAQVFARQSFGLESKVVPNTIDITRLKSKVNNKPMTVVYLGRLVERKGCQQLIEAFEIVNHMLPDARLIIGGKGPQLAELEKLVNKLGLAHAVEFKGFIEESKKGDFLAQATVSCFPSLYGESFGIVLIEAMAAGSGAVLGGNNPGYKTVLDPMPNLIFDPRNKEQLAGKIVELLNDDKKRAKIKAWQGGYVKQFDVNVVGKQMVEQFNAAIAKKSASRHN